MSENLPLNILAREMFGEAAGLLPEAAFIAFNEERIRRIVEKGRVRSAALGIHGIYAPPRVLPSFVRSAAVCEDEVVASYLGGVLCSARTPNQRDDRAVAMIRLMDGLSSYALRAHCIVYASLLHQTEAKLSNVGKCIEEGRGLTLLFDDEELKARMGFQDGEDAELLLSHAFVNLSSNDLTMQGQRPIMLSEESRLSRSIHPTLRGIELYCWGTGLGQLGTKAYFSQQTPPAEIEALHVIPKRVRIGHAQWEER